MTIDTTIAQLFFRDALLWFASAEVNERVSDPGWYALAKPPVWRGLSALALLLVIVGLCRAFAHSSENTKASILWPMAITVVALLSPLSWPYYYIPTLCFAPILLEKLGGRLGGAILFAGFFPMISLFLPYYWRMDDWPGWPPHVYQIVSVLCLCILSAGFLLAYLRAGEPSVRRTTA